MARDRSLVRASDLSAWAFCNRAWWLREVKGEQHDNQDVLDRGTTAHEAHGRQVRIGQRLSTAGVVVLLLGVAAFALLIVWLLMG
jgi:CRISPR/Cas system-associated exonuclease Cas4 (RecB family)